MLVAALVPVLRLGNGDRCQKGSGERGGFHIDLVSTYFVITEMDILSGSSQIGRVDNGEADLNTACCSFVSIKE